MLLIVAAGCAAGCGGAETGQAAGPLEVGDARVRALIPGQDKTVGYFTARNGSDETVVLVGAQSEAARAVEMHTTLRDGDMVRMRRLAEVEIEPGETVRFEPGGRHLMLFGVTALGEGVEIGLLRRDGAEIRVRFSIEQLATGGR